MQHLNFFTFDLVGDSSGQITVPVHCIRSIETSKDGNEAKVSVALTDKYHEVYRVQANQTTFINGMSSLQQGNIQRERVVRDTSDLLAWVREEMRGMKLLLNKTSDGMEVRMQIPEKPKPAPKENKDPDIKPKEEKK